MAVHDVAIGTLTREIYHLEHERSLIQADIEKREGLLKMAKKDLESLEQNIDALRQARKALTPDGDDSKYDD